MILFLDFDGVLHPEANAQGGDVEELCHLPRFEAVMRQFPSVDIVISSMWRYSLSMEALRALFSEDIRDRVIGATALIERSEGKYLPANREAEIVEWLEVNKRGEEAWLALDDADWQFQKSRHCVVLCHPDQGFDEEVANTLVAQLREMRR